MKRDAGNDLVKWIQRDSRKPIVLRGARQVGKTWLVRDLAARSDHRLIELNFEADPGWRDCFIDNDPKAILDRIGFRLHAPIDINRSILFLDEIQAFGEGLAKLRWFAENTPRLPVVAAGSLLEFVLRDHAHSMPVGRIDFYNLDPIGFAEYLAAHGQHHILDALCKWRPSSSTDAVLHRESSRWMERFSMTGGMPGIVSIDVEGGDGESIRNAQRQLTATYRADFPKYSGRIAADVLDEVLRGAAHQLGQKFVYSKVDAGAKHHQIKSAVELLDLARVCQLIQYSAGNGIPLASETKEKFRKIGLLDIGILHALVDTPATPSFPPIAKLVPALRSKIAEQMTTQQLRLLGSRQGDPQSIFYWQREGGRPGEIDFLIQMHGRIIPIELKSGAAGSMKSLHQFMFDKGLELAVRIDSNPPSLMNVDVKTTQGDSVAYQLLSIPLYLLYNLEVILAAL